VDRGNCGQPQQAGLTECKPGATTNRVIQGISLDVTAVKV